MLPLFKIDYNTRQVISLPSSFFFNPITVICMDVFVNPWVWWHQAFLLFPVLLYDCILLVEVNLMHIIKSPSLLSRMNLLRNFELTIFKSWVQTII